MILQSFNLGRGFVKTTSGTIAAPLLHAFNTYLDHTESLFVTVIAVKGKAEWSKKIVELGQL